MNSLRVQPFWICGLDLIDVVKDTKLCYKYLSLFKIKLNLSLHSFLTTLQSVTSSRSNPRLQLLLSFTWNKTRNNINNVTSNPASSSILTKRRTILSGTTMEQMEVMFPIFLSSIRNHHRSLQESIITTPHGDRNPKDILHTSKHWRNICRNTHSSL